MSGVAGPVPHSQRLLVLVGPSGAGKDTVMTAWQRSAAALGRPLRIARRTITRPPEAGGEAHEALSEASWRRACEAGDFAVHWQANGLCYGVRREELQALEEAPVLLNGSRAALAAIRAIAPRCRVLLLSASPDLLAQRLRTRGREDEPAIAQRLERAPPVDADFTIANDGTVAECVAALMRWWEDAAA